MSSRILLLTYLEQSQLRRNPVHGSCVEMFFLSRPKYRTVIGRSPQEAAVAQRAAGCQLLF